VQQVQGDVGLAERVTAIGRANGLDHIGIAPAAVMGRARQAIEQRIETGMHDGMQFTFKNPARSTDPGRAVRGARSMIVAARSYALAEPRRPGGPLGAVARYAWMDHYAELRAGLWAIAHALRAEGERAVVFADDNSIVDREAAWLAGIGWFGKNANVLVPGAGSFFVLGAVVTTADLPHAQPVADGCGTCRRCLDGCPTRAIVAPGVVDASRCLAWLLQRTGVFPREYRRALGNRIYGCDDCQTVCPPNVRVLRDELPEAAGAVAWAPLVELLDASDDELIARYGRWYIPGRELRWMRRNALVALGNTGDGDDPRVASTLARYVADADEILRAHAVWAAAELGLHRLLPGTDAALIVRDELALARA
jgi:epoxyqueuosine reductase